MDQDIQKQLEEYILDRKETGMREMDEKEKEDEIKYLKKKNEFISNILRIKDPTLFKIENYVIDNYGFGNSSKKEEVRKNLILATQRKKEILNAMKSSDRFEFIDGKRIECLFFKIKGLNSKYDFNFNPDCCFGFYSEINSYDYVDRKYVNNSEDR
jgi:hypothetical protein